MSKIEGYMGIPCPVVHKNVLKRDTHNKGPESACLPVLALASLSDGQSPPVAVSPPPG